MNDYLNEIDTKLKNTKYQFLLLENRGQNLNFKDYKSTFLFHKSMLDMLKKI